MITFHLYGQSASTSIYDSQAPQISSTTMEASPGATYRPPAATFPHFRGRSESVQHRACTTPVDPRRPCCPHPCHLALSRDPVVRLEVGGRRRGSHVNRTYDFLENAEYIKDHRPIPGSCLTIACSLLAAACVVLGRVGVWKVCQLTPLYTSRKNKVLVMWCFGAVKSQFSDKPVSSLSLSHDPSNSPPE
jgi:hypothetical protein